MSLYHDLVAGDGSPGFRDGVFFRARFRDPAGIAVLAGGTILAIADQSNNRIRAVYLDEGNRVETLAGSGRAGDRDGTLREATFNQPIALTAISDHALLVNDEGNALFRVVDLQTRRVETVAGAGERGLRDGEARRTALGNVSSLAYSPAEDAVFFAQPSFNAVRRLDLKTHRIQTILVNDPRVPGPQALALFQGKLCVADGGGRVVRVMETSPDFAGERTLIEVGRGKNIRAMAESDGRLYGIQGGVDSAWICISTAQAWDPPSVLAEDTPIPYLRFDATGPVGIAADPRSPRSFFVSAPVQQEILCVRDYRFHDLSDKTTFTANGLVDFDYPPTKPPRTFRILMIGDSHISHFYEPPYRTGKFDPRRMESMPKRLELMLNTLGALESSRLRYEVLSLTRVSWQPLLVWSAHMAPAIARKFDVDLVLLMEPPGGSGTIQAYLERPITAGGIPSAEVDVEYLLKPLAERLQKNPAARLVALARTHNWTHPLPDGQGVSVEQIAVLATDEATRRRALDLHVRPLAQLRKGLQASFPGGSAPRFVFCYYLLGGRGPGVEESPFWKDVAAGAGAEYLDLTDPLVALRESWYPISEAKDNDHLTPGGHEFFAFLLAHQLLRAGWVPMGNSPAAPARARPPGARRPGSTPRAMTPP